MLQVAPPASELPQLLAKGNCAVEVILVMLIAELCRLVSVTVCGVLGVFTIWWLK